MSQFYYFILTPTHKDIMVSERKKIRVVLFRLVLSCEWNGFDEESEGFIC